ncbi:Choline transporter-like [Penicillium digitatum]|uniref:Protein PNS1 n=2 Tax=Penicillium digitatum TaxID=36651 RepID=A0A7T6XKB5_PENDI|nr:Choline transporter-like [Penicillium digitatum]
MFSEYASRFLAQSQSRVTSRPDDLQRTGRSRPGQHQGSLRHPSSRSFLRPSNPYGPGESQTSQFPFAPRSSVQQAPLFFSATDEFREEDDETEREREIADFYALQRSRRNFGDSNLKESSELDDSECSGFEEESSPCDDRPGKGIKSSWRGEESVLRARLFPIESMAEAPEQEPASRSSPSNSKVRGHLVDIGLDDSLRPDVDDDQALSSPGAHDPPVQRFREREVLKEPSGPSQHGYAVGQADLLSQDAPRPPSSASSFPTSVSPLASENTVQDAFWGQLFLISLTGLFASAFLVYLHTSTPSGDKSRWGDTIYMTVHGSFFLLGIYTIVSILVSLIWLALLRFYVRLLVHVILVAVPTILCSFSLYPFISSFNGPWHGMSIQDKAMRWSSAIPFLIATMWIYNVVRGRQSIGKAIGILEFACRILAANPELLALGLGALVCVVSWTWIWMLMFTRVFLGGHFVSSKSFIIDVGSWWLGIYFVVVYLWSIGIIAGIQRAVTAATVSQWYFHRLATPAPTSRQIVQAAVVHAATTLFGTISLSRLLGLLVRLPLLLLPGRISSLLSLFAYSLIPTPITFLTNPLSLTYAAIHSQPLAASSRGLSQMTTLAPSAASMSLYPRSYSQFPGNLGSLLSYRLSKLILYAARFMMSLALGFGGWVTTARSLTTPTSGSTIRGSLYAYVVGLIAGTIGWTTLGAMEGVIADIVDAAVICWASEVGISGREARYCREAGWLFGDSQPRFGHEHQEV